MRDYVSATVRDYIPEGEATEGELRMAHARLHGGSSPDYIPEGPSQAEPIGTAQERQEARERRARVALEAADARQVKRDVVELVEQFLPRVEQYKTWRHLVQYIQRLPLVSRQYALVAVAVARTPEEQAEVFRRLTRADERLVAEYLAAKSEPAIHVDAAVPPGAAAGDDPASAEADDSRPPDESPATAPAEGPEADSVEPEAPAEQE